MHGSKEQFFDQREEIEQVEADLRQGKFSTDRQKIELYRLAVELKTVYELCLPDIRETTPYLQDQLELLYVKAKSLTDTK